MDRYVQSQRSQPNIRKIMELWLEILDKYPPISVVTSYYGKNRLNLSKECQKLMKKIEIRKSERLESI